MKDYKLAVFIGRFQPFHNSHEDVVKYGLEIAEKVLVIIGSYHASRSVENPFSYEEREFMVRSACTFRPRIEVEGVRDYYYNMPFWIANVQGVVDRHTSPGDPVALIGSYKDESSYYLNLFPQYDLKIAPETRSFHGTAIRNVLWANARNEHGHVMPNHEGIIFPQKHTPDYLQTIARSVPDPVFSVITTWMKSEHYGNIAKENEYVIGYKKKWESSPFPPIFVTTDAVVTCSGHVLVVERGMNPGKGLFALPGGFLKQDEEIENGMLRELKEETRIRLSKEVLASKIVGSRVFDHPERSSRGRTISHGYHIKLRDGELPEVKGADDAKKAFWMPLWDVTKNEDKFFEDHAHIINYFTNVGGQ